MPESASSVPSVSDGVWEWPAETVDGAVMVSNMTRRLLHQHHKSAVYDQACKMEVMLRLYDPVGGISAKGCC